MVVQMTEVTDQTFETAVLDRSEQVPVVVDLWAPWCGPCKTLGPILEKVVGATEGAVELVKVNVDENPGLSAAFQVQSIPAVFAVKDRKVADSFIGALPESAVAEFVNRLAPQPTEADNLVARGDEESLRRALELDPTHEGAVLGLAELLVSQGHPEEALGLLEKIPETPDSRRVAALARLGDSAPASGDQGVESRLDGLLTRVKEDEAARREYLDILEALGSADPRTAKYRKALATQLH